MSTPEGQIQKKTLTTDELEEMFRKFLGNRGMSPEQGGQTLMQDNYELREKNRTLTAERDTLAAKVPPAGAVVLAGDDLKNYNELVAAVAGKKPDELATIIKEHGELGQKVATMTKEQTLLKVASVEGWKPEALQKLAPMLAGKDVLLEEVEEEQDDPENAGQKVKVKVQRGMLAVKDASGAVTKTRISEELKDFADSLKAEKGKGKTTSETTETRGTKFVRQSQGGKAAATSVSDAYLKKAYKQPAEAK